MNNNKPYIDNDIENIEFYLSWMEFKSPPSRRSIYSPFKKDEFYKILTNSEYNLDVIMETSESINEGEELITSTKKIMKISDNIFLSYLEEEDIVMNITAYFKFSEEKEVSKLLNKIQDTIIDTFVDNEDTDIHTHNHNNIFKLSIDESSLYSLSPLSILSADWENSLKIYNKKVKKKAKKLYKNINKKDKGLHIISGNRGSGKTYLIKILLPKIEKRIIYIPLNLFDITIQNSKFIDFLKLNQDSVLVIDDCENYFNKIHQKSNLYVNNLLQILESIEDVNIHILLSLNIKKSNIDENLLFSKSCLSNIDLEVIEGDNKDKLSNKMGFDSKSIESDKKYL